MKKITFLLFLLLSISNHAQESKDRTYYVDYLRYITTKTYYVYKTVIKDYYSKKDRYEMIDYYKSGAIRMRGFTKEKDKLTLDGECVFYYESGEKSSVTNYKNDKLNGKSESWYKNGNLAEVNYYKNSMHIGESTSYYYNGNKKEVIEYKGNSISNFSYKTKDYWNKENIQTVINGNGYYEMIFNNSFESGQLKNGAKDGEWKGNCCLGKDGGSIYIKDSTNCITYIDIYKKGEFISGTSTDSLHNVYNYNSINEYTEPKKGSKEFNKFIKTNFMIDTENKGKTLEEIPHLNLLINKYGKLIQAKITLGPQDSTIDLFEAELIKLQLNYSEWIPQKVRGIPMETSSCTIPLMPLDWP